MEQNRYMDKETFIFSLESLEKNFHEELPKWNALKMPRYKNEDVYMVARKSVMCFAEEVPHPEEILATFVLLSLCKGIPDEDRFVSMGKNIYMSFLKRNLPEFSREMVFCFLKYMRRSDLSNSGKEYVEVIKENKNQHVADILGLIIDELEDKGLMTDKLYEEILNETSEAITVWRKLEVPKIKSEEAYKSMMVLMDVCLKYGAYISGMLLAGMCIISTRDYAVYFPNAIFITGKIAFELGYKEVAKNCFLFADEGTNKKCWENENDKKYEKLLAMDTVLEIPEWVFERDKNMRKRLDDGELESVAYENLFEKMDIAEELEKKAKRQRANLLRKNVKKVSEEWDAFLELTGEELHKKASELIEILGEVGKDNEFYEQIHRFDGEAYFKEGDIDMAEQSYDKAYMCDLGRYDVVLMEDYAALSEAKGQKEKANAYRFRAGILQQ